MKLRKFLTGPSKVKKARSLVKVVGDVELKLIGVIHLNTDFENDIEISQNKYLVSHCLANKETDSVKKYHFNN